MARRLPFSAAWVAAPAVLALGFASGFVSGSAANDPWFSALAKPSFQPPGWLFPVAWTALYLMTGAALGLVLDGPASRRRNAALGAFAVQLVLNLCWSPTFFRFHQAKLALVAIVAILAAAAVTTLRFAGLRPAAAWLMTPYLAWLVFATALNAAIVLLNPGIG